MSNKILVKFGPRVKRVELIRDEGSSFKQRLENSIRAAMKADPFMKDHAASGFFLSQYDEISKTEVEIDESMERWEVDFEQPINLMFHNSVNLVSKSVWHILVSPDDVLVVSILSLSAFSP
jgi:hypothetical protein